MHGLFLKTTVVSVIPINVTLEILFHGTVMSDVKKCWSVELSCDNSEIFFEKSPLLLENPLLKGYRTIKQPR